MRKSNFEARTDCEVLKSKFGSFRQARSGRLVAEIAASSDLEDQVKCGMRVARNSI
jgi:hypothetical protein